MCEILCGKLLVSRDERHFSQTLKQISTLFPLFLAPPRCWTLQTLTKRSKSDEDIKVSGGKKED